MPDRKLSKYSPLPARPTAEALAKQLNGKENAPTMFQVKIQKKIKMKANQSLRTKKYVILRENNHLFEIRFCLNVPVILINRKTVNLRAKVPLDYSLARYSPTMKKTF